MEKWLVPGQRHETYKTIREHLVEPEREKVLETEAQPRKQPMVVGYVNRDTGSDGRTPNGQS